MLRRTQVGWASPTNLKVHERMVGDAHPTRGFTLVEMLVAMAITLVMMAAVVTLFANVSNSVRNRRATIEMSSQLRHLRNVLQQDLQGATCPGVTWQKPESNHGYIELIEGQYREGHASNLIDGIDSPTSPDVNPEIDHKLSVLPSSNLPFTSVLGQADWATDGAGLGDYDDILMLTSRNEREPFVGKSPTNLGGSNSKSFEDWSYEAIESPLAEVIWFAIENPAEAENANRFFGEPGMRTIYRRALLIAPWVNPYLPYVQNDGLIHLKGGSKYKPMPGLCRILPDDVKQTDVAAALAALIAFQDRYDLSVRVEWDYNIGHWKIVANSLSDLTKRENRYLHYGFWKGKSTNDPDRRIYPYAMVSIGSGYPGSQEDVEFVQDGEIPRPPSSNIDAKAKAHLNSVTGTTGLVFAYTVETDNYTSPVGDSRLYSARPFAFVKSTPDGGVPATARAMLDDEGHVVRVVHGPVPLWGTRRGEDVMMTDAIAFDVRVFDPGAPLFGFITDRTVTPPKPDMILEPGDPGWTAAYTHPDNTDSNGSLIGEVMQPTTATFPYMGQGAYVDMGYGYSWQLPTPGILPTPNFAVSSYTYPWFFMPRAITDVYGTELAPGYTVYDTWSFHYENDGVNEDGSWFDTSSSSWKPAAQHPSQPWRQIIDQGVDGLDNSGGYGVDDVAERETAPPYDKPLRGAQVLVRAYERDSRAVRQARINQHFMPE